MQTVAEFSIAYKRIINPQGEAIEALPAFAEKRENLVHLYRIMQLTRTLDTKAIALQRTGKMGTFASNLGQEAIGAAIGFMMQKDDVFCPYYRDYAAQLQRGVSIENLYSYWAGDERGNDFDDNPHDFPIAVPMASQNLHATGAAYAFKYRKQARVAVTTVGEGGTSKGDFYEAINVSGMWQLPGVFVINNNQWAISLPRETQTRAQTIAQKAIAAGFDGVQVDGNDVIATAEAVGKAIDRARAGEGPTVVEAITYRLSDHTTADDASRYRSQEELDAAWQEEPIIRLQKFLQNNHDWSDAEEKALLAECKQEVDKAVISYQAVPKPAATDMLDYLYAELPDALQDQRLELLEDEA